MPNLNYVIEFSCFRLRAVTIMIIRNVIPKCSRCRAVVGIGIMKVVCVWVRERNVVVLMDGKQRQCWASCQRKSRRMGKESWPFLLSFRVRGRCQEEMQAFYVFFLSRMERIHRFYHALYVCVCTSCLSSQSTAG